MDYHKELTDVRNKRLAHFNIYYDISELPNITWALQSAYLYREWLIAILQTYQTLGVQIKLSDTTGKEVLEIFESQIAEICK